MTIFSRPVSQYIKSLNQIHKYLWYCFKCIRMFRQPWSLIYHYFTRTRPHRGVFELRNGLKIFLSEHPDDVITVFLIFIREDYGKVKPGNVVIDIGANIGVFSLYAIYNRAKKVYAYEPNSESYARLLQNISANNLEHLITPNKLAVSSVKNGTVKFPVHSSAHNAIITEDTVDDFEIVKTTTLEDIVVGNQIEQAHLLKLDCEGSEYEIVLNTDTPSWNRIQHIKMEYHSGKTDALIACLKQRQFALDYVREDSPISGHLWFEKIA